MCVPEAATVGEGSLLQVEGMRQKMVCSVPGRKQGLCVRVHIRGSRGGRKPPGILCQEVLEQQYSVFSVAQRHSSPPCKCNIIQ